MVRFNKPVKFNKNYATMHFTESRHRVMTKWQTPTVNVKTPISMIIIIEVFPSPFLRTIPRVLFQ